MTQDLPPADQDSSSSGADPIASLRASLASASVKAATAQERIPSRYRTKRFRRAAALGLFAVGAGAFAWSMFGPDNPRDLASNLTDVRDAAAVQVREAAQQILPTAPEEPVQAALAAPPIVTPTVPSEEDPSEERIIRASAGEGDCAIEVNAMPLAAALIAVDVAAPCDSGARVDVLQGALQVAVMLDENGAATVELPALTQEPAVAVLVTGRDPVTLQTEAVDVADYHRAVLHWTGTAALELHAFEGDADYGDDGHVSPDKMRTIAHALSGNGGYLSMIGDTEIEAASVALVYTVPVGTAAEMSIEAPVTEANCGRAVQAGTIQSGPGVQPVAQQLSFVMPECDAVGELVMLGDLMQPIAVASN